MSRSTLNTRRAAYLAGGAIGVVLSVCMSRGAMACSPPASPTADEPQAPPSPSAARPAPQGDDSFVDTSGVPEWIARIAEDPSSPESKKYAAQRKTRLQLERELKKVRAEYFRATKNAETRQVGISKLRQYTDPALFPLLVDLFKNEDRDVRAALLDHFVDQETDEADATLAWGAVFDDDPWYREEAQSRVQKRVKQVGRTSDRVKWAAAAGLKTSSERVIASAAQFAQHMHMYDAIPAMINMQVGGGGGGAGSGAGFGNGGDPGTSLAYIMVGTQQAFVSDLTPVVGDNAVAFDPTLSVATEGVVLRVIDAVVITYRTEVNAALIALSTEGWGGRSTASMGWDNAKWRFWHANEFVPHRRNVELASGQGKSDGSTSKP